MPSVRGMPAKPEAMPVAKGLTVEPSTPMPAPSMTTATPVRASKPSAMMAAMTRT